MGWWRVEGPSGHVDWSSRAENGAILCNRVPGKDSPENYYNGDEVADILDKVVNTMLDRLTTLEYRLSARQAFLGDGDEEMLDLIDKQLLVSARNKITRTYKREWGREPYPEELQAIFEFCTAFIQKKPAVKK
jgi:hypothetical protein